MNRQELKEIILAERMLYLGGDPSERKSMKNKVHKRYLIWRYLYYFRYWQFYRKKRNDKSRNGLVRRLYKYKCRYYEKKKNIYSYKSGVEIGANSIIGKNCDIWHGGVVINGTVGDNCVFHGNNIIGNKGKDKTSQCPVLGNGVDVGANAVVIGAVRIADDCVIGAGTVAVKSFDEPGRIIVGVPAKAKQR